MAEDRKAEGGKNFSEEITFLLIGLFLLSILINRLVAYFNQTEGTLEAILTGLWIFLSYYFWPSIKVILALLSFAAVFGIFYLYHKLREINEEEWQIYGSPGVVSSMDVAPPVKNENWEHILELINSSNASDWRLAIIEADVILDDLTKSMGYHGDTLGERLKAVEKSDFLTIDDAWEAHKIRNAIAHRGQEFPLNEREAKHAISLFEKVFKEFNII